MNDGKDGGEIEKVGRIAEKWQKEPNEVEEKLKMLKEGGESIFPTVVSMLPLPP